MTIQFNHVAANIRVPLWHAEVNAAQTPYQSNARLLLIGQMDTVNGSAETGKAVRVFGSPETLFGYHSMLTRMCKMARANAPLQEIWALPLADDGAGVAATATITTRVPTAVRARTTANITLSGGAPDTTDGVALAAGDLIAVTEQTAGAENGIYEVTTLGTGSNGTWARHSSMDVSAEVYQNRTIYIQEGTAHGKTSIEVTNASAVTLDTTAITFGALAKNYPPITNTTTVAVYINGVRVRTTIGPSDTAQTFAARLAAAINASEVSLPATAAQGTTAQVDDHQVTLTARHKGAAGNSIGVDLNYYLDEGPATEIAMAVTAFTGGSGDPDINSELAALADEEFDWIGCPYSDAVNLGYVETFLNGATGRWAPTKQLYGHYICAKADTSANLASFGATQNDPHASVMGTYKAPNAVWDWAAALAAKAATHLQAAPGCSRPLQTIKLEGILPPKDVANRFDQTTRQSLYFDGISGYHVTKDNDVQIDRLITTYQLNEWGDPDASFLDVNTLAQTMVGIRHLRTKFVGQYGRAALADENPFGVQGMVTPEDARANVVHAYRELVRDGVFENEDEFANRLIVERNATDPNRLDFYIPADHVNQLRIAAVNYVSHLQYGIAA